MSRQLGLVAMWACLAPVAGVILWVPLGAIAHGLWAPVGPIAIAPTALLFLVYAFPLGLRALAFGTPSLAILFGIWALLCRRWPSSDSRGPLALFALTIAIPGASVVSACCHDNPLGFSWVDFGRILPFYVLIFWGAIMLPRWLLPPLAPGAFSDIPSTSR